LIRRKNMAIIKYAPFTGLEPFPGLRAFEDTMNRLLSESNSSSRPWMPAVDIWEDENELVVRADIPDVKFEDIHVDLENGTMTLRGERKFEKPAETEEKAKGGYHRVERAYGAFERSFTVPETVDSEHVKADYKNGVLTVTLPKKESAKPRKINIEVSHN
jgi:HSP20 family protein